jgi:serine/threonine protein kinase
MKHFKKVNVLGSGNYGTVYCCKDTSKQEGSQDYIVAVKRIPIRPVDPSTRTPNQLLEIEAQKSLNHPHIVRLIQAFRDDGRHELLLVLEYCKGGDLKGFMKAVAPAGFGMPIAIVQRFTAELISALLHLRRHRTFHRDLKSENILLSSNDPSTADLKISDFGFAKTIAENVDPLRLEQTTCGSPLYMAPERCRQQAYSFESDVWSAGLIIHEMAFGKHLFHRCKNREQLDEAQKDVQLSLQMALDSKQGVREVLETLLVGMLAYNPADRPSLVGIVRSSPWLQELLCYNEDLRYLVRLEGGDESWLREPAADDEALRRTQSAEAGGGRHDGDLESSEEVVELASEVKPAGPSPRGYRAMAGHALLWCQQTMSWILTPFSPASKK